MRVFVVIVVVVFFFFVFLCARGERKVRVLERYNVLTAIDIEMIFCDLLI